MQGGRRLGLDRHHAHFSRKPRCDAADQPAPADRHQERVKIGDLIAQLHPDRSLAEQRLDLVESMHGHRATLHPPSFAGDQRVSVPFAADHQIGAVAADAGNLRRRGNLRHEYLGSDFELVRRIGHRNAMVAARCRDHAGGRHIAHQQIGEGSACLERTRVLHELELEMNFSRPETEVCASGLDHGRVPDIWPNTALGFDDRMWVDTA